MKKEINEKKYYVGAFGWRGCSTDEFAEEIERGARYIKIFDTIEEALEEVYRIKGGDDFDVEDTVCIYHNGHSFEDDFYNMDGTFRKGLID